MSKLILITILMYSSFTLGSVDEMCQIDINEKLCAKIEFVEQISRKKDSKFNLSFYEKTSKKLVSLKEVPEIKLWMRMKNGHEHGSAEVKIKQLNDKYLVENVWFLMIGQWSLKISGLYKSMKFQFEPFVCVRKNIEDSKLGICK